MHEAPVFVCSLALHAADKEGTSQGRFVSSLQADSKVLAWYIKELLQNIREEIVGAALVGAALALDADLRRDCPPLRITAVNSMAAGRMPQGAQQACRGHWTLLGFYMNAFTDLCGEFTDIIAEQPWLQGMLPRHTCQLLF